MIIIGTGAGGGTLARHLAPSGKRILLLERGDWLPREPQNWLAQDVFVDNRYVSRGHLVRRDGQAVPAAGPLLRRRRDEALRRGAVPAARGGLRRAAPPRRHLARVADRLRRDGAVLHGRRAALRGARRARRGPDRAAGERAVPVPGRLARAADPAALRRPRRRRATTRSTRRAASCSNEAEHAVQRLRPLPRLRRLPVRWCTRKSDAEVLGVRPALEHPNVTLLTNARGGAARDERRRHRASPASSSSATATTERYAADIVVVSCGAANTAALLLASASDAHPNGLAQRLRPGRPQLHVPQQPGRARALARGEPDGLPEDARAQRLLLRQRTTSTSRSATSRWSASRRRRCSAARSRARRSSRRSGRSSGSPATRSTSGSRPRTCRGPRTASRVDGDGRITLALHADQRRAEGAAATRSSSRCSASSACTSDHLLHRHAYLKNEIPVAGCAHQAGTCRFGADPATSVLDADCRAHEVDNLYVVDTSFFPSIGAVNPALTAMANALRVGDHLLERLGVAAADRERCAGMTRACGDRRRRVRRRSAARSELAQHDDVRVTLIDRNNYHQFQPLLYQVATVAARAERHRVLAAQACSATSRTSTSSSPRSPAIDPADAGPSRRTTGRRFSGDVLVLAAGSRPNFFRTPGAPSSTLPALLARRRRAPALAHPRGVRGGRPRPGLIDAGALNFVIVGGGADRRRGRRRAGRHDQRHDAGRVPRPRP